jgi:hypothetical protein
MIPARPVVANPEDLILRLHEPRRNEIIAAMIDQIPDRGGCGLKVELQPDNTPPDLECLLGARRAPGERHCPRRQIERLAVPVKRRE